MEDEVVIVAEPDKWSFGCNYEKVVFNVNQPITHKPEYLAVRDISTGLWGSNPTPCIYISEKRAIQGANKRFFIKA